jgi:dipeptidyl-peptidase-3
MPSEKAARRASRPALVGRDRALLPFALAGAIALAGACRSAPRKPEVAPSAPPTPSQGAAAPGPKAAPALPATPAPAAPAAAAPVAAPKGQVIATVGDTAVVALEAKEFAQLSREQRLLAYWLSQAGNAGDAIAYDQSYRHNLAIVRLLRAILTHAQAVPPSVLPRVREYARLVYLHHGLHDEVTARKLPPPFSFSQLRSAALAAQASGADFGLQKGASLDRFLRELEGPLFDPAVDALRTNKAPPSGQDPLLASAVNLYQGVSMKDLTGFHEHYPLNSRLIKEGGRLVEQVYRSGQPTGSRQGDAQVPPGRYADRLARVNAALEQAMRFASGAQLRSLRELHAFFRTGDPERFRASQREWLKEAQPVDFILGFIESYADPRGQKALWEGFVGIEDVPRSEALKKLAEAAQAFEDAQPWPAEYKRQGITSPAVASLVVVAGSGDDRPQAFTGVNLPNENAEREKYGSKSFLLPGYDDAMAQVRALRIARELAPPGLADEIARCRPQHRFTLVALHEIVGHGSGRISQKLADAHLEPSALLKETYNTLEEARADLVALFHGTDPKVVQLGLMPDAACQASYPQFAVGEWLAALAEVPQGDRVEEDHLRAGLLLRWWFADKGALEERSIGGKRYLMTTDAAQWHAAAGGLLALLQDLKARGDYAQAKSLLDAHATRLDPAWRDEVISRIGGLGVPRRVLGLSPVMAAVLADGKVMDATLEPVRDLDARILADWSSF